MPECLKSRVAAHILLSPYLAGVHARNQEFYSGGRGGPGPTAGKQSGQRFLFCLFFFCCFFCFFIVLNLFYS